ncbi:hypothetical protein [Persephonella sp.]
MAKSLIRNTLGSKTYGFSVPAGATDAVAFADAVLDGEYEVYTKVSESGNENVTSAYHVRVQIRDSNSDKRDYITIYLDINKNENDLVSALKGKVINGINVDEVVIINFKKVNFS